MFKFLAAIFLGGGALFWALPSYAEDLLAPPPIPSLPSPSSIPPSAPGPSLRLGDSGDAVEALQQALSRNGFDPGPIDGSYGPLTRDAVADFQRVYDLDETGVAGPDTLDVLGLYNTGDTVVANPPGGSSGRRSSSPYVAAITESSRKLPQVQQVFGNASIDSARPGRFINIGRYSSYSAASDRVREARRFGFDARILYQRR